MRHLVNAAIKVVYEDPVFVEKGIFKIKPGQFDSIEGDIDKISEVEFIDHVHHAGNSSAIVDGAALAIIPTFAAESLGTSIFLFAKSFLPPTGVVDVAAALRWWSLRRNNRSLMLDWSNNHCLGARHCCSN